MRAKRRYILLVIGLSVIVAVVSRQVQAQGAMDIANVIAIKQNCGAAQKTMQTLEKQDAVSRINRGLAYDEILREIDAINSRFSYNKIPQPILAQTASQLQLVIESFRSGYVTYSQDLSNAVQVNCEKDPQHFYDLLTTVRADRADLGAEVQHIDELLMQYRSTLVQYQNNEVLQ